MTDNDGGMREAQVSLAVRKAFRQLLKKITSEPTTLVIEPDEDKVEVSDEAFAEIREWLFRGRQK